jgi:hypothetical protein
MSVRQDNGKRGSFMTGLVTGLVAGLTVGLVTVAHSTTGKKAWERFGDMFQAGYVSGFQDCVRIAKAMDQEGYVARTFILPPGTKPTHFQAWVDAAYEEQKYAEKTVPQLLVLAGYKLEAKFGPETPSGNPGLEGLRHAIERRREAAREAEQATKDLEAERAADAAKAGKTARNGASGNADSGIGGGAPPPAK